MRTNIVAGFVVLAGAAQLAAQGGAGGAAKMTSYQIELTGGFSTSEADTTPDLETKRFFVAGTYHLKPVMLADHPWNEAAFLEHSTFVQAGLSLVDFDAGGASADGPVLRLGGTYAEKDNPIAAQVNLEFGSLDGDNGPDVDLMTLNGRCGYWLQPNAIVGGQLTLDKTEIGSFDIDVFRFGAFGKIVHSLGEGRSVNAEAHLDLVSVEAGSSDETNVEFGVAGDFYFTPQYSAGAFLDLSFGDAPSEEGITLGLRGTAWIMPQLSANLALSTFMADNNAGADEDTFSLYFSWRM